MVAAMRRNGVPAHDPPMTTTDTDTTSRNLATIGAVYEAFGRGDVPFILDQLAADVVWETLPGYGVPYLEPGRGRDHVAGFFSALGALTFHGFEVRNLLAGGDQVAAIVHLDATVQATGVRVADLEVHLWTFGPDGTVTEFSHVLDRHAQVLANQG